MTLPFSPHRNFADNLRALCTRHGSIAAVCRSLGMNRQQFNKYLAGSTLPNAPTLERICSFFGVGAESLFQDPKSFGAPPLAHPAALPGGPFALAVNAFGRMRESSLRPGCYHVYVPWRRDPSKCVRSALYVYRSEGTTLFTRFTKFRPHSHRQRHYVSGRHDGVVLESDTAKFLLGLNRKGLGEMSLVTLGLESNVSADFMSGLSLEMGTAGSPLSLRTTLEYRGASSALRRVISDACILPMADPSIPEEVRLSVSALPQPAGAPHLEPFSLFDSLGLRRDVSG